MNSIKVQLTKSELIGIKLDSIFYFEYASAGAMGNDGGVIFYLVKDEKLLCYETNLFTNEELYNKAVEFVIENNNQFHSFYGGFGNHVFINKKTPLEIGNENFVYTNNDIEFIIQPSVLGVFNEVVAEMKSKNYS